MLFWHVNNLLIVLPGFDIARIGRFVEIFVVLSGHFATELWDPYQMKICARFSVQSCMSRAVQAFKNAIHFGEEK